MYQMRTLILRTLLCGFSFTQVFMFAHVALAQSYQDTINKLLEEQKQTLLKASSLQQNTIGNLLDVKTSPSIPLPGATVRISIESYLSDLYKASIQWSVNGKVVESGIGRTSFSFQNGSSGETTTVSLYLITNTGEAVSRDFTFTPIGVNVLWEADTYTPPFYKGKPMMVPQANIRIIAIPDKIATVGALDAGNLVYSWKKDDYFAVEASGHKRNSFSFVGPKPLTNTKITLDASTFDDSARSETNIYLPQVRPFVLLYEKNPLLGVIYSKPLDARFSLAQKEVSIVAEPYFFSNEKGDGSSPLKYSWLVNGKEVQNFGREITLRNDTGMKGASEISFSIRGVKQNFQSATKKLLLDFNDDPTSKPLF